MGLYLSITILLVVMLRSGAASAFDGAVRGPIPIIKLVHSSVARSTTDTVDAVIRCVLHDPSDDVELRLGTKAGDEAGVLDGDTIEYRLKIEETLSDWIMVDGGYHRLSGLKQGVYNLRVQARHPGRVWGEELRIHLHVERRQRAPWLFYGLIAILAVPSAFYARLWYRRRATERQLAYDRVRADERRRIARDLHDDVGSGLARIVVLSDAVAAADESNQTAATIAVTAREVIESVRTIVWVMKSENDSAIATLSYVRDRVADLLQDHGIAFHFDADITPDCVMIEKVRWNVMMCVKETVTNIVRHSMAENVWMQISCSMGYISIHISDDGVGFDTEHVRVDGGLTHIRERMTEIGGTAGIGSRQEGGTNILLVIPA